MFLRKKMLFGILSIVGLTGLSAILGTSYTINLNQNRYQSYGFAPLSSSTIDLIQSYFSAATSGSKLLYLASFVHADPITQALNISKQENQAKYEYLGKTGYLLIDNQYGIPFFNHHDGSLTSNQPIWSTNVAAVEFRSDLGSFMTGIAIGQFLNENSNYFDKKEDKTKFKYGMYGAQPFTSILAFMNGFQQGIKWFNENVVPKKNGYKIVEQEFVNQDFSYTFDSTSSSSLLINEFLNQNIDVLIPIAGAQISQATRLVKQSGKNTIIIGVDSPVEDDQTVNLELPNLDGTKVGNNQIVQFSSVKNIDIIVNKITQIINDPSIKDNTKDWENIDGIGYNSLGNVNNNGVGVSEAGKEYFARAMTIVDSSVNNSYDNAIVSLSNQTAFKDLDKTENKVYVSNNNSNGYNYNIANNGFAMVPITGTKQEIEAWFDKQYANNTDMMNLKDTCISNLLLWIANNQDTINNRSLVAKNLQHSLEKDDWEKNHSVIRIMYQSATSVLFDHSFLQSCYIGLKDYWATHEVYIPNPPSK